ncbi:hypothetical protein HDU96_004163 [Phlyctochytrium bullatum]|nr:hypothetical protein HDU96_004163 [Phlyctochytrium bullatum]
MNMSLEDRRVALEVELADALDIIHPQPPDSPPSPTTALTFSLHANLLREEIATIKLALALENAGPPGGVSSAVLRTFATEDEAEGRDARVARVLQTAENARVEPSRRIQVEPAGVANLNEKVELTALGFLKTNGTAQHVSEDPKVEVGSSKRFGLSSDGEGTGALPTSNRSDPTVDAITRGLKSLQFTKPAPATAWISLQPFTAAGISLKRGSCIACGEEEAADVVTIACESRHGYCGDCMVRQARAALKDRELIPLRCCGVEMPRAVVQASFRKTELLKYDGFLEEMKTWAAMEVVEEGKGKEKATGRETIDEELMTQVMNENGEPYKGTSASSILRSSLVVPVVDQFRDAVRAKNSSILTDTTSLNFE